MPFAVHTADGEPLSLRAAGQIRHGVAFRPADPDLDGLVMLDFDGFDAWYEEDEPRRSATRATSSTGSTSSPARAPCGSSSTASLLAESARAQLLFEHPILPVRAYLPPADIRVPLQPSPTRTRCPYKGEAAYWSLELDGRTIDDLAWSYEDPLEARAAIAGLVGFFNERVDVSLDGRALPRPRTGWSEAAA